MERAKPRLAVLLGAGASADAGIPTTVEMTNAVIERMESPGTLASLSSSATRLPLTSPSATRRDSSNGRTSTSTLT